MSWHALSKGIFNKNFKLFNFYKRKIRSGEKDSLALGDKAGEGPQKKFRFRFPEVQVTLDSWDHDTLQTQALRVQWACVSDLHN